MDAISLVIVAISTIFATFYFVRDVANLWDKRKKYKVKLNDNPIKVQGLPWE